MCSMSKYSDDDWAFDRARDEATIDAYLEAEGYKTLFG